MSVKNVDSLIVQDMQNQQASVQPIQQVPSAIESTPVQEDSVTESQENVLRETSEPDTNLAQSEDVTKTSQEPTKLVETSSKSVEAPIDEYGNPVEAPKMYSEDEVQRIIKDRLSRNRNFDQSPPSQREAQQRADDFKADPNSEESWETQLEAFVEKTIEKRQTKQAEAQWKQQEASKQAEFEAKFTSGMNKYQDFHQVVAATRESITNTMMLATRSLENPAAFIYGASKMHPTELARISRIGDAYTQAVEVGRLHEKMVKNTRIASNAPAPIAQAKSDIAAKRQDEKPNIDYLIAQHAKQKMARK